MCTYMYQGHPTSIFGKYLFGRRFEIQNFRNICCKISCLPASPRILKHPKNGIIAHFYWIFTLKRTARIFGAFFLAGIFKKVSLDPYNFRIIRLSARKSEQIKNFGGIKYAYIYHLTTKIHLTMPCLSGFELYSRWVFLMYNSVVFVGDKRSLESQSPGCYYACIACMQPAFIYTSTKNEQKAHNAI